MPTRTGTASEVNGSAGDGSTSVTVPSDATMAVAFWAMWDDDTTNASLNTLTLGGNSFVKHVERTRIGGANGTGIATLTNLPGTGSQTLAWAWTSGTSAIDEGGEIIIVWVKDAVAIRDSAVDVKESLVTSSVTIATETDDLVLALGQSYTDGSLTTTGTAFIDNAALNSEIYDVTQVTAGAGTTTVSATGNYTSAAAISLTASDLILTQPIGEDGTGEYVTSTPGSWPPTGGTYTDYSSNPTFSVYKDNQDALGPAIGQVLYMRFDTSGLLDDATVTEVRLQMYVNAKTDANNLSLVGDYYDYGGGTSTGADWIETASPSIFTAVDLGAITTGQVNTFTLTDLTGINKTGYTGIRLTLSAITPGFNHDMVQFASQNHAALEEPRLLITYFVPTIQFLHSSSNAAFDEHVSEVLTDDIPAGSLIVVHAATFGTSSVSFTIIDDWNHEYTLVGSPDEATHGVNQMAYTLTTRPLAIGDRIRVQTDSGSTDTTIRYAAYSGCDGTLIDTSHAADQTFPPSPPNPGNVTIPGTETLIVAANINDGGGSFAVPTSGFTSRGDDLSYTSSWRHYMEDRIVSSAGDYASAPTVDNYYWSGTILAFAAGTPPTPDETLVSIPIASSDDDASAYRQDTGLAWPPVGSIIDTGNNLYAAKGDGTTYTYSNNVFFRWDTSSLPDGATPVAARVRAYVQDRSGVAAHMLEADYYDFGGGTPTLADYAFTVTNILLPFPYSQAVVAQVNTFLIDDLSGIDPEGYTGLRFAFSDIGAPPTNINYSVEFASYASASPEAELEIAYTEVATPTFVGNGTEGYFGTGGATSVVADTPSGISTGDTIFFVLNIADAITGSVSYPGAVTQVGPWVTGEVDFVGTVPATGLFRATWDGSTANYTFTFDGYLEASRGGVIITSGYTGDCTHRQVVTGTDPQNASVRDSPTLVGASGNLVIAAMGGSANTVNTIWSGGFTKRNDWENYGLANLADAPSDDSVTATVDPDFGSTQSMWILAEIGPEEIEEEEAATAYRLVPPFIR